MEIAAVILAILGLVMTIAPKMCTRADKRDDPQSVAMIRKLGIAIIGFAGVAALLMLKYKMF